MVKKNGTANAFEVRSRTDKIEILQDCSNKIMNKFPNDKQGMVEVIHIPEYKYSD